MITLRYLLSSELSLSVAELIFMRNKHMQKGRPFASALFAKVASRAAVRLATLVAQLQVNTTRCNVLNGSRFYLIGKIILTF